ncbi:hypothetical protein [Chroococcidiopsis sp. CCMEE 29]|uniref:O-antigen ligase family protein n=1 Tax=Chroococcidiopsis sp. CCMEE 29 TaxID=155894 RepID=UPI0020207288|nr:hypothetical protein [Chroococcidiopsis sp. CCMEE 29]
MMKPHNFEERLIWYSIITTYGLYFLGAQAFVLPMIAWLLVLYLYKQLWGQTKDNFVGKEITIPFATWLWISSIIIMLFALIVAHGNFELGTIRLIKSILKWSREIALWGLFPLIGLLNIRKQLLYRAACILCLQSLVYMLIGYLAFFLNLPSRLYLSPLYKLGGNSPQLYDVVLYMVDYQNPNIPRLPFFAPWPPNMAFVGIIYFFIVCQESNRNWRLMGMAGAIAMVITPYSRSAILCFPITILLTWILTNFTRPVLHLTSSIGCFLTGIFATQLINLLGTSTELFNSTRASSSSVRLASIRISLDRWWNEAPIWGHGTPNLSEPLFVGPSLEFVGRIFLGTGGCGTWVNLLYTKGLVGFIAFAVPFIWSFMSLLNKAQKSPTAKAGLSILLAFFFFSFVEELDQLAYIYWPGLLMIGIALKEEVPASVSVVTNERNLVLRSE